MDRTTIKEVKKEIEKGTKEERERVRKKNRNREREIYKEERK